MYYENNWRESNNKNTIKFWGSSFVTNSDGNIILMNDISESTSSTIIDLTMKKKSKKMWGFRLDI